MNLKSILWQYGWKTYAGVLLLVIAGASQYSVWPDWIQPVAGFAGVTFVGVGARVAIGKIISALAELKKAIDEKK